MYLRDNVVHACLPCAKDLSSAPRDACAMQCGPGCCMRIDLLDQIQEFRHVPVKRRSDWLSSLNFDQKQLLFNQVTASSCVPCAQPHHAGRGKCPLQRADMDVTGTPCIDFSPTGLKLREEGNTMIVFLAWVCSILFLLPLLVLHENVPLFPVALLERFLGHVYGIRTFVVAAEDHGFELTSRKRRYTILWLLSKVELQVEPCKVLDTIHQAFANRLVTRTEPLDCAMASTAELVEEIRPRCTRLNIPFSQVLDLQTGKAINFRELLSISEFKYLESYEELWQEKFHTHPALSRGAVFFLGDNPRERTTWSGNAARIPGMRARGGLFWIPYLGRWLTVREHMAAFGYPTYEKLATAANQPLHSYPATSKLAGNAMHVASVGCMILVALVATRPIQQCAIWAPSSCAFSLGV